MGVSIRMDSSTLPLSGEDPLALHDDEADADSGAQAPAEKRLKIAPDSPTPQSGVELEEVDKEEFAFLDKASHLGTLQSGM